MIIRSHLIQTTHLENEETEAHLMEVSFPRLVRERKDCSHIYSTLGTVPLAYEVWGVILGMKVYIQNSLPLMTDLSTAWIRLKRNLFFLKTNKQKLPHCTWPPQCLVVTFPPEAASPATVLWVPVWPFTVSQHSSLTLKLLLHQQSPVTIRPSNPTAPASLLFPTSFLQLALMT